MFHHYRVRVISLAVAGAVALLAGHRAPGATADFLYEPQTASQSGVTPGTTVNLELFLLANSTNGVSVINTYDGLLSGGLAMHVASHTGTSSTIASYALDTSEFTGPSQPATITGGMSLQNDSESVGTGSLTGITFGNTAGGTVVNPSANHEIYLGTVTLMAGSAGSSTVFDIGENGTFPNNDGGFTLTFNPPFALGGSYDLDDESQGNTGNSVVYTGVENSVTTFTLNVAGSVPEPGTLGLLTVGMMLGLRRRRPRLA